MKKLLKIFQVSSSPNKLYKPDFAILDCLRGIAALYVVINHCRGHLLIGGSELVQQLPVAQWSIFQKLYYTILRLTALGNEFVIVFFVLSGYSIAYSISHGKRRIGSFYKRRAIRLYLPLVVALIWAALVFKIISIFEPALNSGLKSVFDTWKSTLLNFLYIPNGAYIPQFWSLSHEVIFYLLAPLFLWKRTYYYIFSIILYVIGYVYLERFSIISKFIFDYNFYFVVGIWLFYNYNVIKDKIFTKKKTIMYLIILSFMILMSVIQFLTTGESNKLTMFISSLFSIYLIINFQEKMIKNKFLLFLGAMSYTIYITHFASMKLFNLFLVKINIAPIHGKITTPFIWMIGVVFCVICSYFFYLIAEKPMKAILDKLRKQ